MEVTCLLYINETWTKLCLPRGSKSYSTGNSSYTGCEQSEDRNGRKKSWSCLPKMEECGPHRSSLWTSEWTWGPLRVFAKYYKFSPLRKFFVILMFWQGDKRAHCKHCNLAFMHCLFKKMLALFETNFAGRKTWNFYSSGEKMRNTSSHQGENERQWKKANSSTYNISSKNRVTRKVLGGLCCSCAKPWQRNVQKKVCRTSKVCFC